MDVTEETTYMALSLVRARNSDVAKATSDAIRIMKADPSISDTVETCVVELLLGIASRDGKPDPFAKAKVSDYLNLYEQSLAGTGDMPVLGVTCPRRAVHSAIRTFVANALSSM